MTAVIKVITLGPLTPIKHQQHRPVGSIGTKQKVSIQSIFIVAAFVFAFAFAFALVRINLLQGALSSVRHHILRSGPIKVRESTYAECDGADHTRTITADHSHQSRAWGIRPNHASSQHQSGNLSGFPLDRCSPHQNLYLLSLSHLCWPLTKPPNHSITFWFLFFEIMLHPPQHGNLNSDFPLDRCSWQTFWKHFQSLSQGQMQMQNHFPSTFQHVLIRKRWCLNQAQAPSRTRSPQYLGFTLVYSIYLGFTQHLLCLERRSV